MIWFLLLFFWVSQASAGCPGGCCGCDPILPMNQLFSVSGCYTGNNVDNRTIPTGIDPEDVGLLIVCEKTAEAGNNNSCVYRTQNMVGDFSCGLSNTDMSASAGHQQCAANFIQGFTAGAFQIGTGTQAPVNANGRPFCWELWTISPNHGTFTFTGDGTGDRNIDLTTTPDVVFIWRNGNSSSVNNGYGRMVGMPTEQSYALSVVGEAVVTSAVEAFIASPVAGVRVGVTLNVSAIEYFGAWWKTGSDLLVFPYVGNGTGLGAGTCGSNANRQTFVPGCLPVRHVWTINKDNDGGDGQGGDCSITHPSCLTRRSDAVGFNITGPGNLTNSDDCYGFLAVQPNNSGPGLLCGLTLTDNDYIVTGNANFITSCNDLNIRYYSMVTCAADGPGPGSVNAADWSTFMSVIYPMDIDAPPPLFPPQAYLPTNNYCSSATGGTTACPSPACNCNLTEAGTVTRDTTNKIFGDMSAAFDSSGDSFAVALAVATPINVAGSMTWGIRHRDTSDVTASIALAGTTTDSFAVQRNLTGDTAICRGVNTGGSATDVSVTSGGLVNTWHSTICLFDDTGNTLRNITDTTDSGTFALTSLRAGVGDFRIGGTTWTGQVQEFFVYNKTMTTADWCRTCACGISGRLCSCFVDDPIVYLDQGRIADCPAACATSLPSCNKAAPD